MSSNRIAHFVQRGLASASLRLITSCACVVVLAARIGIAQAPAARPQLTQFGHLDKEHLPREATGALDLAVGDVDGDGRLDVLLARGDAVPTLALYVQSAHARFDPAPRLGLDLGAQAVQRVALADLDGDQRLDVVTLARAGQDTVLAWHQQTSTMRFTTRVLVQSPAPRAALALLDVDGDGDLDVLVGCGSTGLPARDELWRNDGPSTFTALPQAMPLPATVTQAFAGHDFDRDGRLDLVVAAEGPDLLLEWDGTAAFTVQSSSRWPSVAQSSAAIALGDLDGDGDVDVVVAGGSSSQPVRVLGYLDVGGGTFSPYFVTQTAHVVRALLLFDQDGDRDQDLLLVAGGDALTEAQRQDRFLRQISGAVFTDATTEVLPRDLDSGTAARVADLDADGDMDLVIANEDAVTRVLLQARGGDYFDGCAEALDPDLDEGRAAAFGDVDGDGHEDLVVASGGFATGGPLRLLRGDGYGGLRRDDAALPQILATARDVALLDADQDGDLDLFVAQLGNPALGATNLLFLNDGRGTFAAAPPAALPADRDHTNACAHGDLDGDGDTDLVLANGAFLAGTPGGTSRIYLGDGRGSFASAPQALPAQVLDAVDVALGDVDGDGDLDLALACRPLWDTQLQRYVGGRTRLYLNDGRAGFRDVTTTSLPVDGEFSAALRLLDADGDGDLDLFVANRGQQTPEPDRLYFGDGSGQFTDVTSTHLPTLQQASLAAVAGDVDGDDDIDLFVGGAGGTWLLLNDGSGRFHAADEGRFASEGRDVAALALHDYDGDQDLDLWCGRAGRDRLYVNFARQIRAPYLAQLGTYSPIYFHARSGYAQPGQAVVPFVSFLEAVPPGPVPPWGAWRVDISNMQMLYVLPVVGSAGVLEFPLWVPSFAVVPGARLYVQALVLHEANAAEWRFTALLGHRLLD